MVSGPVLGPVCEDDNGASPVDTKLSPEGAARLLFQNPRAAVNFSARTDEEAQRAVEEFARLFEAAPGVFKEALEGARSGARTLSADRLQGLAEMIQNADDARATHLSFQLVNNQLIAIHDGNDVTLSDVLALATPWLSNKSDNDVATGRFGIGLMTLRALSDELDVHSGPYHIRLGAPSVSALEPRSQPVDLPVTGCTALCLPLRAGSLSLDDITTWLGRWDDSALLFLNCVREVSVLDPLGRVVRLLRLSWQEAARAKCRVAGHDLTVQRRHAIAPDGRRWLVHTTEAAKPDGVHRVRKAAGASVPLGLALALHPGDQGWIYAGLPLVETSAPLRVNAQFDPVTSRSGLAPTRWNSAMLPLLGDLWVEVVDDLLAEQPIVAWDVIPLPNDVSEDDDPPLLSRSWKHSSWTALATSWPTARRSSSTASASPSQTLQSRTRILRVSLNPQRSRGLRDWRNPCQHPRGIPWVDGAMCSMIGEMREHRSLLRSPWQMRWNCSAIRGVASTRRSR